MRSSTVCDNLSVKRGYLFTRRTLCAGHIPVDLGKLTGLQKLILSNNQLTGEENAC